MVEYSDEVKSQSQRDREIVDKVVSLALPLAEPEYIFYHEWLEEVFELLPVPVLAVEKDAWDLHKMTLVKMFIETMLKEEHIQIESAWGKGYQVIDNRDTAHVVNTRVVSEVNKVIDQSLAKLYYTSTDGLTIAEKVARKDESARLSRIRQTIKDTLPCRGKLGHKYDIDEEDTCQDSEG